jgi:AcrR family transcriptional regulator
MARALPFYVSSEDPPARQQILLAAMKLFSQRGLSSTTIRDIADESGYTNPALYRHFKSKEALALYMFETAYTRILTDLDTAMANAATAQEKLVRYIRASIQLFEAHPEAFLFVNDHLRELWPHVPKRMKQRTLVSQARELVEQVAGPGIRAERLDLATAALLGTFAQWARLVHFGGLPGPASHWVDEMTRLAMRIIA